MPTASVNGLEIFYQDDDFAPPWIPHETVVMVHGFCRNGNVWRSWVPSLARHFRVIRMDLRGCGGSGDPGSGYEFNIDDLQGDLLGLLDRLGLDRVHYVGEALGGILGAVTSVTHPERFRTLTLVSTPTRVKDSSRNISALGFPSWQEALETVGMREWWLRVRAALDDLMDDPAADRYFAEQCARTPVHVAVAISNFTRKVALEAYLPRITVPTLVLSPGRSKRTFDGGAGGPGGSNSARAADNLSRSESEHVLAHRR